MKKIKFVTAIALLFAAFNFTSCENEPIDSALNLTNGGGNNGGGNNGGGTSTGDYWPSAINNQWIFNQNGADLEPMKVIGTDNFGGATYYKFNQPIGQTPTVLVESVDMWLKKTSGDYYIKIGDININAGGITGVMTGYEFIVLKDYLNANQTWSGTYNQDTTYNFPGIPVITMTTNYTGTIVEKGISMTINGVTYNDVIKTHIHQVTSSTMAPSSTIDTDYWFSKNIGPIKAITTSDGASSTETELVSYIIN